MISAPNWSVWEVLLKFQSGSLRQLLKQNQPTSDPQKSLSSGNLVFVKYTRTMQQASRDIFSAITVLRIQ